VEEISAARPERRRGRATDHSDIRPTRAGIPRAERRRADSRDMYPARALSFAVAPATRPVRRPAAPKRPAVRLSHWLGLRRRAR